MLQIYLYQYWTVAETQKKGRSAPRPCVDLIIIIILICSYDTVRKDSGKITFSPIFCSYRDSVWNFIPKFKPQSWTDIFCLIVIFQPSLPLTQTPLTTPLPEKSWLDMTIDYVHIFLINSRPNTGRNCIILAIF